MPTDKALIITPDGAAENVEGIHLTPLQAQVLRQYKKIVLQPLGLKEALYCERCWNSNLSDGCDAFVTDHKIAIRCRCSLRVFDGQTI